MKDRITKQTRLLVYEKYGGRCAYCGKEIELREMQVDHIIPVMRGYTERSVISRFGCISTNELSNLNPSCRACNFRKGMSTLEQFKKDLTDGIKCCQRDFTYRMMVRYGLIKETPHEIKFYFEQVNEG